jgi:hypothetical protein
VLLRHITLSLKTNDGQERKARLLTAERWKVD